MLRIGIDASNLRSGGGVSHLMQLLSAADPGHDRFSRIIVWASEATASLLPQKSWLAVNCDPELNAGLAQRIFWQQFKLPGVLKEYECDVLFSPGGTVPTAGLASEKALLRGAHNRPTVTASQNLLPFMAEERSRYKYRPMYLKLCLLEYGQAKSFRSAQGVIFLTNFARSVVMDAIGKVNGRTQIIPHGVDGRFFMVPRPQKAFSTFSQTKPFKLLYVSTIDFYKHQWNVARAAADLRKNGLAIEVSFVGGAYLPALRHLRRVMAEVDPEGAFLRYHGAGPFSDIHSLYHSADAFVFASTCENMPNIILEAMAAGLPIVCSNREPMTGILGDAGVYMDPLDLTDIQRALETLVRNADLREKSAFLAYERAKSYTWQDCARNTFAFIRSIATM